MPTKPTAPQTEDAALFREFEHTGDLGIELDAPTRGELFRRAAIALAAPLVETAGVAEIEQREIAVEAEAGFAQQLIFALCFLGNSAILWATHRRDAKLMNRMNQ